MDDGNTPDRPAFAAGLPPATARTSSGSWLRIGCGVGTVMLLGLVIVAVVSILSAVRFIAHQFASTMAQVVTVSGVIAPLSGPMLKGLSAEFSDAILQSWGIDRAAENARRLEYVVQSLREYEQRHGMPPVSLSELNLLASDREDVWGVALEYRVEGTPPQWQIRSAGRDRRFEANDPWLPER